MICKLAVTVQIHRDLLQACKDRRSLGVTVTVPVYDAQRTRVDSKLVGLTPIESVPDWRFPAGSQRARCYRPSSQFELDEAGGDCGERQGRARTPDRHPSGPPERLPAKVALKVQHMGRRLRSGSRVAELTSRLTVTMRQRRASPVVGTRSSSASVPL